MRLHWSMLSFTNIARLVTLCLLLLSAQTEAWTPIVVRNVTLLGPQITPDVTNVSRDGGYSALINGNIVWLYDDTECMDKQGNQLSFISNTAAYANQPGSSVTTTTDFGTVDLGSNPDGTPKTAILAHTTVGTGGWIPFQQDELQYNEQMNGRERVAICDIYLFTSAGLAVSDQIYRARYISYVHQYHRSLSLRTSSLCGQQASRSV